MTITLMGMGLGLVTRWTDVLAHAASVELGAEMAVLHFDRVVTVPGRRSQAYRRSHAVTRELVDLAAAPAVWQYPLERAVQQLVAEVAPFGTEVFKLAPEEG